jgi:hypothetical protein
MMCGGLKQTVDDSVVWWRRHRHARDDVREVFVLIEGPAGDERRILFLMS